MSNIMRNTDIKQDEGFGYKTANGKLCMIRCFKCGRENWALAVSSGTCAWCGYDANKKPGKDL